MDLYSPATLKELCEQFFLSPSKEFGQNYLITPSIVEQIVVAAQIQSKDTILEVGPGFGVLTQALAKKAKNVISYEIEQHLKSYWEQHAPENVEIIWGNVLHQFTPPQGEYKLVANLPYQITSDALKLFLDAEHKPSVMVIMVQKEVGERMLAKQGKMSMLSVACQYYGAVEKVCDVKAGNFWPAPKIDSVVIKITLYRTEAKLDDARVLSLARKGFAAKRKTLVKNLCSVGYEKDVVLVALEQLGCSATVRAQELSVKHWITLATML